MGLDTAEVERALLALAPEERAEVIREGLRSLDDEREDTPSNTVDDAWHSELERRVNDIVEGRVALGTFEATRTEFVDRHPPRHG